MAVAGKAAYVFPGQGAQKVGMGQDLYERFASARAIFDRADHVLGFPLTRLCFEGPEEDLRQTINAQPALVTASIACLEAVREAGGADILPPPAFLAGHSLGEYTALAVAGVYDFPTAVRLARERGRLMHEAGQQCPGSMAAVLGMAEDALSAICAETGTYIANINCPGQIVISGDAANVDRAAEVAREKGAHRVTPLKVSGAFHTPLMQFAFEGMSNLLPGMNFKNPNTPVIANTTATPLTAAADVKQELLDQLCNCVQWQRSVEDMIARGVTTFIELGPGKVLTGLIKRINADVSLLNIGDLASLQGYIDARKAGEAGN
ncbi:MAG: ACP S-malonyltransferase [Chloroflexota bacterium]